MNITLKFICVLSLLFLSVYGISQESNRAQTIIDKAIIAHGGDAYDDVSVGFTFRKKEYSIELDKGAYKYSRSYKDTTGFIQDVLTNDGFERKLDGHLIALSDKDERRYSNSLNSVCYFAMLPNGLNDTAVKKSMIGLNKIDGQKYHVIKISFAEEGGGDDHDDEYVYWINQKTNTVDFLAYSFHVNGGGVRFRAAMEPVVVDGVRFQNYVNYKHSKKDTPIDSLPFYYVQGELTKLSEIINENVRELN